MLYIEPTDHHYLETSAVATYTWKWKLIPITKFVPEFTMSSWNFVLTIQELDEFFLFGLHLISHITKIPGWLLTELPQVEPQQD